MGHQDGSDEDEELHSKVRDDLHMTSALRGREGVGQILTEGREVACIWY